MGRFSEKTGCSVTEAAPRPIQSISLMVPVACVVICCAIALQIFSWSSFYKLVFVTIISCPKKIAKLGCKEKYFFLVLIILFQMFLSRNQSFSWAPFIWKDLGFGQSVKESGQLLL